MKKSEQGGSLPHVAVPLGTYNYTPFPLDFQIVFEYAGGLWSLILTEK